jgi:hypothetical protein
MLLFCKVNLASEGLIHLMSDEITITGALCCFQDFTLPLANVGLKRYPYPKVAS